MMDIWVILWIIICITILISVLESISRRAKEQRRMLEEQELQRQINMQQFHVYSLQPYDSIHSTRTSSTPFNNAILSIQQQQQLHRLQELKAGQDLPPKYEDVVLMPPVIAATDNNNSTANSTSQNPRLERY